MNLLKGGQALSFLGYVFEICVSAVVSRGMLAGQTGIHTYMYTTYMYRIIEAEGKQRIQLNFPIREYTINSKTLPDIEKKMFRRRFFSLLSKLLLSSIYHGVYDISSFIESINMVMGVRMVHCFCFWAQVRAPFIFRRKNSISSSGSSLIVCILYI